MKLLMLRFIFLLISVGILVQECICTNTAFSDTTTSNATISSVLGGLRSSRMIGTTNTRIIGGNYALSGAFPWFANLNGCGGMLVAPDFVLTAAHCSVLVSRNKIIDIGDLCKNPDNCGQRLDRIQVLRKFMHPNFTFFSDTPSNDFMLLQLSESSGILPVKLDNGTYSNDYRGFGKKLLTVGMGITDTDTLDAPDHLHYTEINYIPQSECRKRYANENADYHVTITPSMMCAGYPNRDACQGDSGGPLYDKENDVLVGVTSWGYDCAHMYYPGVYARIADQWEWMKDIICARTTARTPLCQVEKDPEPDPDTGLSCSDLVVNVTLRTDFFPSENSWEIKDLQSGATVGRSVAFEERYKAYDQNLCLKGNTCYQYTVFDSEGDGINLSDGYDLYVMGEDISSDKVFEYNQENILFGEKCEQSCRPFPLRLDIRTGDHGDETKWTITSVESGRLIHKGGYDVPYDNTQLYMLPMEVCDGCYTLQIHDSDGSGKAQYTLALEGMTYSSNEIAKLDSLQFGNCTFCEDGEIQIKLDLDALVNGMEFSWIIIKNDDSTLVEGGTHDRSTYQEFCLPRGCYTFRILDFGSNSDNTGITIPSFDFYMTIGNRELSMEDLVGDEISFCHERETAISSASFIPFLAYSTVGIVVLSSLYVLN